jgi:hypothetical protein
MDSNEGLFYGQIFQKIKIMNIVYEINFPKN